MNTMPGAQKVLPLVLLPVRPPSASQVPHLTNGNDNDLQAENALRIKAMPQAFDEHCSATELSESWEASRKSIRVTGPQG